jgi:hypothetical protein
MVQAEEVLSQLPAEKTHKKNRQENTFPKEKRGVVLPLTPLEHLS